MLVSGYGFGVICHSNARQAATRGLTARIGAGGVRDPPFHDGQEPDPATGSVTVPIYQTSTYVQDAVGEHRGYDDSSVANPTRTALQLCLASLERAEHGVAFASGMAATTT